MTPERVHHRATGRNNKNFNVIKSGTYRGHLQVWFAKRNAGKISGDPRKRRRNIVTSLGADKETDHVSFASELCVLIRAHGAQVLKIHCKPQRDTKGRIS
jgi:hypothetical protein